MKKNLLMFSAYHLPHLGGVERYTDNLAIQLTEMGWNVTIVSSNFDHTESKTITHGIVNYKIPIRKLFSGRYPIPKKDKTFRQIFNQLDQMHFDAIIVNTRFFLTSLLGAKCGKKRGIPVFVVEHGSQHLTVDNKVLDFFGAQYEHGLTKVLKKYADYYYGVSEEACRWQKHFGIDSDGVWYNAINDFYVESGDNENFDVLSTSKLSDNNALVITYAGRILKQKGVIALLDAFDHLSQKYDHIELHMAGAGNQLEALKEKYADHPRIIFEGKLDFDTLVQLYDRTQIFVYAPLWPEGLPTSILEAGYMGCACIASPQGGIKEIIEDQVNGLMVHDQNELEQAMEKLILDAALREKLAGALHDTVMEKFHWKNVAKIVERNIMDKSGKLRVESGE